MPGSPPRMGRGSAHNWRPPASLSGTGGALKRLQVPAAQRAAATGCPSFEHHGGVGSRQLVQGSPPAPERGSARKRRRPAPLPGTSRRVEQKCAPRRVHMQHARSQLCARGGGCEPGSNSRAPSFGHGSRGLCSWPPAHRTLEPAGGSPSCRGAPLRTAVHNWAPLLRDTQHWSEGARRLWSKPLHVLEGAHARNTGCRGCCVRTTAITALKR